MISGEEKIGACNFIFCVRMLLVRTKISNVGFFCLGEFFDQLQRSEFSIVFWRAEGFGCMWVPFESRVFNNSCFVFNLEKQNKKSSCKKQHK